MYQVYNNYVYSQKHVRSCYAMTSFLVFAVVGWSIPGMGHLHPDNEG